MDNTLIKIFEIVFSLLILYFCLSIHEFAHAWMADKCGDSTARYMGRLTLNPFAHIDLIGTVIIPFISLYYGIPLLGWAKPVPINPNNFRNFKLDNIKVSAAGIMANTLAAVILSLFLHIVLRFYLVSDFFMFLLGKIIIINVALAFLNLIPIPPLDGSHILESILPARLAYQYRAYQRYGFIIILALLMTGILGKILGFFIFNTAALLLPRGVF